MKITKGVVTGEENRTYRFQLISNPSKDETIYLRVGENTILRYVQNINIMTIIKYHDNIYK